MQQIDGHTKMLALLGDPVEHSFSPQMQNYISEACGLNYAYAAHCVKKEQLGDAIRGLAALGYAGVNVTSPHKVEVMQYLDFISEDAKKYGSVNTVKFKDGKAYGYSTDAEGFYLSLLEGGAEVIGKDILIFGAGGATRPVCVKFAMLGAKSITIMNRTQEKADALAAFVKEACGYTVLTKREHARYDLVINTTTVGMSPNVDACPTNDFSFVDRETAAADMIYNPAETVFLKKMKENGARVCINGLGMLIFQGIVAYEIFTDTKLERSIYKAIKREVFGV